MSVGRRVQLRVIAVGGLALAGAVAGAQESELGAHVGIRATHTDNVRLLAAGVEQSERIAEVRAGVNFSRTTARLSADLDYEVSGVFYDELGDSDQVFHNLNANSRTALVAERFFVDAYGVYDQTIVDPGGPFPVNNLSLTGNRTDVGIVGISPNVSLDFGANIVGEIRQSYTKLNYDDPEVQDTNEGFVRFALANSNARSGGTWGVQYGHERFEYDVATEVEFETFELELGLWATPTARIFTTQGLESDYSQFDLTGTGTGKGGLDEHYWYVGTDWRPDDRTVVQLEIGERNFGTSRRFSWNRQLPSGGLSVDYSEQPSTFLREQLSSVRRVGELSPIDTLDGVRGNLLYLQERFSAAFYLDRPKSNLGFRVFNERRFELVGVEPNDDQETDRIRGAEVSARWQVDARTSLTGTFEVAHRRASTFGVDAELKNLTIELLKEVGRQTELSFGVIRQRDTPEAVTPTELEFEEMQVYVGIERRFGSGDGGRGGGAITRRYSGYVDAGRTR